MNIRSLVVSCSILFVLGVNTAVAAPPISYSVLDKGVPGSNGNAPEDDARPGEYYFKRGVEAFRANDFEHAVKMYETAASWGYKNAQYNLAVMYARGQGVPQDLSRAMAWAALAAERNDKQYVEARETIYAALDKVQWEQANAIWRELKKEYADDVALNRAKARWAEVRNGMTGSHVGGVVGHLEVGAPSGAPNAAKVSMNVDAVPTAVPKMGFTATDVAGANTVDGAIVYRNLRETNNPYDPKFDPVVGTATVEQPIAAGENKAPSNDKH